MDRYIVSLILCLFTHSLIAETIYKDEQLDSIANLLFKELEIDTINTTTFARIRQAKLNTTLKPYMEENVYNISSSVLTNSAIKRILIIVKEDIYYETKLQIIRYAHDIHNAYGSQINVFIVNNETPERIKKLIQKNQTDLNGVVLMGDIIAINYYLPRVIISL